MYTEEQLEEIISLYEPCKRNAAEAARRASFDISSPTILRYWKQHGLKPAPKGGKKNVDFL